MMHHSRPPAQDPLQLARTQIDFAAMSAGAPAVKDILYKAQTMAPYSPPQFWKKAAKGTAVAAAAALLLFAPYIPSQVGYTLLRVEFERPLAPARAQDAIDAVVQNLPPEVTVGIEQRQTQASQQAIAPRVVLRLGAVGVSGSWLRHQAEDALACVVNEAQPLYYPAEEYRQGHKINLVQAVSNLVSPDVRPHYGLEGSYGKQAERLLLLGPVLKAEAGARLAAEGYELAGLKFVNRLDDLPAGYDFTVSSWPLPVAAAVTGYAGELDSEKQLIEQAVADCLSDFNLMLSQPVNTQIEAQWPAITVVVQDQTGRLNPQLAARVQAEIAQPSLKELDRPAYDPSEAVQAALEQVLPRAQCQYYETRTQRLDGSEGWQVAVVVEGERARTLRLFEGKETSAGIDETF